MLPAAPSYAARGGVPAACESAIAAGGSRCIRGSDQAVGGDIKARIRDMLELLPLAVLRLIFNQRVVTTTSLFAPLVTRLGHNRSRGWIAVTRARPLTLEWPVSPARTHG